MPFGISQVSTEESKLLAWVRELGGESVPPAGAGGSQPRSVPPEIVAGPRPESVPPAGGCWPRPAHVRWRH